MKGHDKQSRQNGLDKELELENVYVIDTSVVINDPDVFSKLGRHRIIVPIAVRKELNGLKLSTVTRKADAAAKASQTLDDLGYCQDLNFGVITPAGAFVRVFKRYMPVSKLDGWADNRVVGAALKLREENKHYNVVLLSNDHKMLRITRTYGIQAEEYPISMD
jgi:PhoH-like ATPase